MCVSLAVGPSAAPSPLTQCSSASGDCQGLDLGSVDGASADDCCRACQAQQGCGAAVFVQGGQWGGKCYMKSACVPSSGCASCTTVTVGSGPSPSPSPSPPTPENWYEGIDSIKVLSPDDTMDWQSFYSSMRQAQFSDTRWAILLKRGNHADAQIGVGYYTSVIGVGATRDDVIVRSFYALDLNDDGSGGGATQNFWRSVEGVTATNPILTWATSQACPVRRSVVKGDLELSVISTTGTHWSSGGFVGDIHVQGALRCGTQQQFFFRNSLFEGEVDCDSLTNGAFVGVQGSGEQSNSNTHVPTTPKIAEKPFLVEDNGHWHIAVPNVRTGSSGPADDTDVTTIPISDVFVAKAGQSSDDINEGINGKRALLWTPGIYILEQPIVIYRPNFVVLGIGFPTLVTRNGHSAIIIEASATNARVASVLFEAGSSTGETTGAMLLWAGTNGVGTDIFSRVGAFSGRQCKVSRADVHVQVTGSGTVLDNTWLWHADHDDCGGSSDQAYSAHGLQVDGDSVIAYDLKVEHTMNNLVQWNGDNGQVYFYQSELPYHQPNFGSSGFTGYYVNPAVRQHTARALGVYIVMDQMQQVTAFRVPGKLDIQNIVGWVITGSHSQFAHLICIGDQCYDGDCSSNQCRMGNLPGDLLIA